MNGLSNSSLDVDSLKDKFKSGTGLGAVRVVMITQYLTNLIHQFKRWIGMKFLVIPHVSMFNRGITGVFSVYVSIGGKTFHLLHC